MNRLSMIALLILLPLSLTADNYLIKMDSKDISNNILVIPIETNQIIQPVINSYGLILINSISNKYPTYADGSSSGLAKVIFNMGQKTFQGQHTGYKPYDPNYSSSLIISKAGGDDINGFYPSNLGKIYYNKTYTTGKYYFEVEINGFPHADFLMMSNLGGINQQDGIGYIGNYLGKTVYPRNYSLTWTTKTIIAGDIVQVFLDYDQNRMLMQKLNTTIDDYQNYVTY